jgi:CBS domain-containing protein
MIGPDRLAAEAQSLMIENKVRHLPVVGDGKRLLGLVTRERLKVPPTDLGSLNVWEISRFLSHLKVSDVMIKRNDLFLTNPDTTLEDAARIMCEHRIGSLLVVEDDIVVGIITEVDMLAELSSLLGGNVPGVRVTIRVPDQVGEYAKITGIIAENGWGIYTSGGVPSPKKEGFWDVVIKVRGAPKDKLVSALEKIEGQEIVDARETS